MRTNWPNSPWTRRDLKRLGYYPLTLILGRAFEQIGPANTETDERRLFQLIGRAMPYLGIRWQQSGKCRTPRLYGTPERRTSKPAQSDRSIVLREGVK